MATTNKPVMCYLPPELESFVGKYCKENGITSTRGGVESPRLGTGVIQLLSDLMNGDKFNTEFNTVITDNVPNIEAMVKDLVTEQVKDSLGTITNQLEQLSKLPGQVEAIAGEVEAIKKLELAA